MNGDEALDMFVVYERPTDYPEDFVIRRFRVGSGLEILADRTPLFVGPTLKAARRAVPPHCIRLERDPSDDPKIVEVWL